MTIPKVEPGDLDSVLAKHLTGKMTISQLCDELNARLQEKAEREHDAALADARRRGFRPNCY
jgi:hypothetical protein